MSDRILGIVGLALAAFYLWAASIIPDSFMMDEVGPRAFPVIIAIIVIICSLVFIARPDPEPRWPGYRSLWEIAMAALVMLAYAQLLPRLGFALCTVFATMYLTWRLGSKPVHAALIGVAVSAVLYILFRVILGLSLAKGPLGF